MTSMAPGDISSEDSNIITFFQSFDKENLVSPIKDLSQIFAAIELIIKQEFDYEHTKAVCIELNSLYNLLLNSVNNHHDFRAKLESDFTEYYQSRLQVILTRIFSPGLFHVLYNLDNDHIDLWWHLYRIIELLFDARASFGPIPTETNVVIIRYFQFALFKQLQSNDDNIDSYLTGNNAKPCEFFRGSCKKGFIIEKKVSLMEASVEFIIQNCELDPLILKYFQVLLTNRPTYFSFDVYVQHISIIIKRVHATPDSSEFEPIKSSCQAIEKSISEIMFKASAKPSNVFKQPVQLNTVIENTPDENELDNHIVPNWVRYFEYDPNNFSQQNSDYSKKSTIQSSSVLPQSEHEKHHNRLKQKFKQVLGIPVESPKQRKRWLKR